MINPESHTTGVAVCVITYLRPDGLSRCLTSLASLQFSEASRVDLRIVVVDNDEAGSARQIVDDVAQTTGQTIRYAIEPRRGIPFARNRAIGLSCGCEHIAFVDDDEAVRPDWLNELLATQRRYDADVVAGPVVPHFEGNIAQWLVTGRFFDKRRKSTGDLLDWASTANVLFRSRVLTRIPGPFDERFALTGGSDRFLTLQLSRGNARLIWCNEAVVDDFIPTNRASVKWLVQRAYRTGNTIALCERSMSPALRKSTIRVFAKAVRQIVLSTLLLLPSLLMGRAATVRSLAQAATGWGILLGLVGHRYEEYRTIHATHRVV